MHHMYLWYPRESWWLQENFVYSLFVVLHIFMMKLIVGLISVVLKFLYQNYETTHMLIYRYNSLITSYV